jgi:alpha-beta hydrolase superfamily lysophospholipase
MLNLAKATVRHLLRALGYGFVGAFIMLIIGVVVILERRPDLKIWHTVSFDEQFEADSGIKDFEEYHTLEERLFSQLNDRVYGVVPAASGKSIKRYARGSLADPERGARNWNRSFEYPVDKPSAGIVMLHGMSDSPYSMRSLAEFMHRDGAWVVGLRIPGHGLAPVGLTDVRWQDMAAAVELAVAHVREKVGEQPVYIFGYSNGAALAVLYSLSTLEDASLPTVQKLVLMSPEIGIARAAALASWQARLGHVLGLEKLAWNSILPEYDPYQYKSFAINAGVQAYLLTQEIQARITRLTAAGKMDGFPTTLAFQSVVDATVSARKVAENLMMRLPASGDELVLFDINRSAEIDSLLRNDPSEWIKQVFSGAQLGFSLTLVTNKSEETREVIAKRLEPGNDKVTLSDLGLAWPPGVYSLAHVALPFPPNDPVYGGPNADPSPLLNLGDITMRGETGALRVSGNSLARMHWNPFHSYMEQRILAFLR